MIVRPRIAAALGFVMAGLGCSRPVDTILDCSAQEIRDILRVHGDHRTVDDLSFTPPTVGTAEVTDTGYALRFKIAPVGYQLLFRINRFTGTGTREVLDQNGKLVVGHGGFDMISCKPYDGQPL
jgi:hypothetical protein